jgi:hypothetical protein
MAKRKRRSRTDNTMAKRNMRSRTDNTMAKRKGTKGQKRSTKHYAEK